MNASTDLPLLTTDQMASFVARGFLRFEAVVPTEINDLAMTELPQLFRSWLNEFNATLTNRPLESDEAPLPRSGTPLRKPTNRNRVWQDDTRTYDCRGHCVAGRHRSGG